MRKADRALSVAGALLIGTYFWRLVRPTLHVYFTPDDLMNLYCAWIYPVRRLVQANLLLFLSNPFARPFAAAWYRTIYHFAGFRPEPFHAALLATLFVNIYLTYAVSRRLSGSRQVGAVAALVGCYNDRLASLYFDTGFIYDVLCYCFYFSALLLYLRVRQQNRFLKKWEIAACLLLFSLALSSKEMAVSLPLFLAAYEWLYHRREERQGGPLLSAGLLALLFAAGRFIGPDRLVTNAAYKPHITWAQFMLTSRHFLGDLTKLGDAFSSTATLLLWAALLLIAWSSRRPCLKFAWFFLMLSPLPVAFLYPRGPAQYYVPWFGWTLFAAEVLVWLCRLGDRSQTPGDFWVLRMRGSALVLGLAAFLYPHYHQAGWESVRSSSVEAPGNARIVEDLHRLYPSFPDHAKILFLNDPIPADWWNMLFIVRLSYRNDTLTVDCAKRIGRPDDAGISSYDHVFDYAGGRFFEWRPPARTSYP
jgi:hypothetical protein